MSSDVVIYARPPLPAVVDLLSRSQLPTEDLTEAHCEHFYFTGPVSELTGLVGLELFGEVALLRSLVVSEGRRGSGEGTLLLSFAESAARSCGVRELFLLTTTAERFFTRHGYVQASRETAPRAIKSTAEFSGICPSSSAFMSKQLSERELP